jgi:hypothetical protein
MPTENRIGVLGAISDWLKLLALVVLVCEAVIIIAMRTTPESNPLAAWYPVFMILLLLVVVVGVFVDRFAQLTTERIQKVLATLDPSDRREALGMLIGWTAVAESNAPKAQQPSLRETGRDLQTQLETTLASLAPAAEQARTQLQEYARRYEKIRHDLSFGGARTAQFNSIVAQARALAKQTEYEVTQIRELFASQSPGNRLIALAIVQGVPNADLFEPVLQSIAHSMSGFEQYTALQAAVQILPFLSADQKLRLREALADQRSGGPGKYITPGTARRAISDHILEAIK